METNKKKESLVLDSSVVIKWFCDEENTKSAIENREHYLKGIIDISCPDLVIYEIANALRYNKTLTQKDIKESVNSLMDMGINIIVPTKNVVAIAISLAFNHDITIYDA